MISNDSWISLETRKCFFPYEIHLKTLFSNIILFLNFFGNRWTDMLTFFSREMLFQINWSNCIVLLPVYLLKSRYLVIIKSNHCGQKQHENFPFSSWSFSKWCMAHMSDHIKKWTGYYYQIAGNSSNISRKKTWFAWRWNYRVSCQILHAVGSINIIQIGHTWGFVANRIPLFMSTDHEKKCRHFSDKHHHSAQFPHQN